MLSVTYFTAPWCAPCKVFGPTLLRVAAQEKIVVEKVDVDTHPEKATDILSVPTTIWYKDGNPVLQLSGARDEPFLLSVIASIREGKYD